MKKWLILVVISLFLFGCQTLYKATDTAKPASLIGKEITKKQYSTLQDVANSMLEDKTDYVPIAVDPLETTGNIVTALSPLGATFPLMGLVLGVVGTAVKMGRKYKPLVEEGKDDAVALYELVRGVLKAGNGGGVSTVTGPELAESLRSSTSDKTKVKVEKLLSALAHENVDST